MATFEEQLDSLLERAKTIASPNKLKTASEKQPADKMDERCRDFLQ